MVKLLLQTLFAVPITDPTIHWFHPSALLPQGFAQLYFEYYQKGSGQLVLLLILALIIFELLFSDRVQRACAQVLLLLIGFFWPIKHVLVGETAILISILRLPVPLLPPLSIYLAGAPFFLVLLLSFSNRIKSLVNPVVYMLYVFLLLFLGCVLFLPIISGELL